MDPLYNINGRYSFEELLWERAFFRGVLKQIDCFPITRRSSPIPKGADDSVGTVLILPVDESQMEHGR